MNFTKNICNLVKYTCSVSVLKPCVLKAFHFAKKNATEHVISCPRIMPTTGKQLNAKGRNGSEIHFERKETGAIHLTSIPIYFVAITPSVLLCLYALRFVVGSYKTGSTPIADLNKTAIAVYAAFLYTCSCHRISDPSFTGPSFVSGSLHPIEMLAYEM